MSGLDQAIYGIPYQVRVALAVVMFVEAGLLAYGLAVMFPLEFNEYVLITLALAFMLKHLVLARRKAPVELRLEKALERLKKITGLGHELEVRWIPNPEHPCSGEVKGSTIYVYEGGLEEAEKTLLHEFVEWLIYKALKPRIDLLNILIGHLNQEANRQMHIVAEAISKIIEAFSERGHETSRNRKASKKRVTRKPV